MITLYINYHSLKFELIWSNESWEIHFWVKNLFFIHIFLKVCSLLKSSKLFSTSFGYSYKEQTLIPPFPLWKLMTSDSSKILCQCTPDWFIVEHCKSNFWIVTSCFTLPRYPPVWYSSNKSWTLDSHVNLVLCPVQIKWFKIHL